MADDKQKTPARMSKPTPEELAEMKQLADDTVRAMEKLFEVAPEVEEYVRRNYRPA